MLRVTVDMVPFGIEERTRTIGTIEIALQNVTGENIGHYVSTLKDDGKGTNPAINKVVRVEHPRKLGAYLLVQKCIEEHWSE